jgi:DNA-binding CsgD family transcriptional regulator
MIEIRESRHRLLCAALDATPDVFLYIRRSGEIRSLNRAGQLLLRELFPWRRRGIMITDSPLTIAPVLFELVESLRQASESSPSLSGQGALALQGRTLRYYARDYTEKGPPLGILLRLVLEVPRIPVPAEEDGGWRLTRRERELVTLMARGRSTTQICTLQGISRETFKTHLKHIYEKTGAHGRVDLMVRVRKGRPDRA